MKYRIALVEYLNTLPFSEGLKMTGMEQHHEVFRVTPDQCAALFQNHEVDISLCPVGALEDLPAHEVGGKYCIGADGEVRTVKLLSKVPADEITSVRLDPHSRTSNLLLQILAHRWWGKNWDFYTESNGRMAESCVMIGDKVFENEASYPYQYDLAEAWKSMTGLPMVFAVWIASPAVPQAVFEELDQAFEAGWAWINQPDSGLADWQRSYLTENISYPLDDQKRKALALFREYAEAVVTVPIVR